MAQRIGQETAETIPESGSALVKAAAYTATIFSTIIVSVLAGFTREQVVSLATLVAFIAGSLFYWRFRLAFALIGSSLLFLFQATTVEHFIKYAHLDVFVFLAGMMIVVGVLEERGFFDWLLSRLVRPFTDKPRLLAVVILMLGFFTSALVDEVTSILFMLAIVTRIAHLFEINPTPFILFLIFTTNIGSSATLVGNPVGVLIAFNAGFTFTDFLRWSAPEAIVSGLLVSIIGTLYLSHYISLMRQKLSSSVERERLREALYVKWDKRHAVSLTLFLGVLSGLMLHHQLEQALGLPHNTLLLATPLLGAGIALILEREHAVSIVEKRVDWWTLLYFILLFASIGSLDYTGATERIAEIVYSLSGGDIVQAMIVLSIVGGLFSAFMDNVVAVATLAPIVTALAEKMNAFMLWWTLLKTATYWGNMTVVGSTANIVAAGYLEKRLGQSFSTREWIKVGAPITLATYLTSFTWLYIQHEQAPTWTPPR